MASSIKQTTLAYDGHIKSIAIGPKFIWAKLDGADHMTLFPFFLN